MPWLTAAVGLVQVIHLFCEEEQMIERVLARARQSKRVSAPTATHSQAVLSQFRSQGSIITSRDHDHTAHLDEALANALRRFP